MIVVHLAASLKGGAGIATQRIHNALQQAGVDSRVLVRDGPSTDSGVAVASRVPVSLGRRVLRRLGLRSKHDRVMRSIENSKHSDGTTVKVEVCSPPFSDFQPEVHSWLAEADIVHAHWTSSYVDWPRMARSLRKPLVHTLHDQEPYLGCVNYRRDLVLNPSIESINNACRSTRRDSHAILTPTVVGNSEWNTNEARNSGVFPKNTRYETILYPLDSKIFSPGPSRSARSEFEIPENGIVIGFACDLIDNPRKGMGVLIEALGQISPTEFGSLQLLSFGRNPTTALKELTDIPWNHLGPIADPQRQALAYRAMDLMIVPSLEEAFGQTAIEAAACGTAVVASDCGGLPEATVFGKTAVLVPAGDPTALSSAIKDLLHDEPKRRQLGESARQKIIDRHTPAQIAASYISLYESC